MELKGSQDGNERIMKMMQNTELSVPGEEAEAGLANYTRLPLSRVASLGTAFQPLATAVQTAVTGAGGSGIYYVNTSGKTMFQMKGTSNYIGSLQSAAGKVGGGQAQLSPLACDPAMLFMAAALANIDKKLDAIKEMQQEMMDFLVQKEKSEMKGNLIFLADVFNNYKYNWNNAVYKNSSHIKVLDIRQDAETKIIFYREQIMAKINKKAVFHSNHAAGKQLQAVQDRFKDYQLALYLLAFSFFLEVLILGNYDEDYLAGLSSKLEDYSFKYRELYSKCYDEIEGYYSSSIQSAMLKGISKASISAGKFVEKIPVISDTQADETLIAAGGKLSRHTAENSRRRMQALIERQSNFVRPFIENINTMNELHNKPVRILVDSKNMYLATVG